MSMDNFIKYQQENLDMVSRAMGLPTLKEMLEEKKEEPLGSAEEVKHGKAKKFWGQEEREEHEASELSDNPCYWCLGRYKKP